MAPRTDIQAGGPATYGPVDYSNIQAILGNPQLVAQLQAGGIDPYAYADQQAQIQSQLAYSQNAMQILAGLGSGGGGSNPVLDDLAHQGVANDQSYLGTMTALANKKPGLTNAAYQAQLGQLANQSQGNAYDKQLLGIQAANTKMDSARLDLKSQDVGDAITKLGFQLTSLGYDKQDVLGAIDSLGLDKQQLGNAMQRLGLQHQDIGVQKEQAGSTHETQQRNLFSDATARGAVQSVGLKANLGDNDTAYQQALSRLNIADTGVNTQESDNRLQGQQLDIQGGKLRNDYSRLGLQEAGVNTDINTTNRQYQSIDMDRQQVANALKGLGIQMDQLGLKDSDLGYAKQLLGIQNQGDQLQQYGDLAQLNNQATALSLKDQGIGQSAGGGNDNAGTLAALQYGQQVNQLQNQQNSLTGQFSRGALGAIAQYGVNGGFGSQAGALPSLSSGTGFNPYAAYQPQTPVQMSNGAYANPSTQTPNGQFGQWVTGGLGASAKSPLG